MTKATTKPHAAEATILSHGVCQHRNALVLSPTIVPREVLQQAPTLKAISYVSGAELAARRRRAPTFSLDASSSSQLPSPDDKCVICCSNRRDVRCRPCGHLSSCATCTLRCMDYMDETDKKVSLSCVLCKKLVTQVEWNAHAPTDTFPAPPCVRQLPTFEASTTATSLSIRAFISAAALDSNLELAALASSLLNSLLTPQLMVAVEDGDVDEARAILVSGVSVQCKAWSGRGRYDWSGADPMWMRPVEDGGTRVGNPGCDSIEMQRVCGLFTPIQLAAHKGDRAMVDMLLEAGAQADGCERPLPPAAWTGATPLFLAARRGHDAVVRRLLDAHATVDLRGCGHGSAVATPLYAAAEFGHESTVGMLCRYGAEVNAPQQQGATPLFVACQEDSARTARLLLAMRASVDRWDCDGTRPIHWACLNGNVEIVRLLCAHGAAVNAIDLRGDTPLCLASGHEECEHVLREHGATTPRHPTWSFSEHWWRADPGGDSHSPTHPLLFADGAMPEVPLRRSWSADAGPLVC